MAEHYAIEMRGITKTFGSVVANKDINLNVKQGEILALLGENGSGKTTLMNMLSGIYTPDRGSIYVDGKEVKISSPEDSKKLGIGMVHQHFKLVDVFSAADNIWMGKQHPKMKFRIKGKTFSEIACLAGKATWKWITNFPSNFIKAMKAIGRWFTHIPTHLRNAPKAIGKWFSRFPEIMKKFFKFVSNIPKNLWKIIKLGCKAIGRFLSKLVLTKKRYSEIKDVADRLGFSIDPKKKVYNMAVSEKQTLEIIKVLYYGAKIIILDEPTAVLTAQEIEKLFAVLRRMKEEGHAIIIITHKLNEVLDISDRVAILRKGEYITTVETAQTNEQELTEWMVGRKVDLNIDRPVVRTTHPLLEVRDLHIKNDEGATAIDHVSFYIRAGEILGVAGIAGCGQKELCEAIAGLRPIESGQMIHEGDNIVGLPPKAILEKGISMSFIPEDRLGMGLAPSMSIIDNMLLKSYQEGRGPFVDRKRGRAEAMQVIKDYEVVTPSAETPVRRLSGGNVQKVLLGREIKAGPNVIVTAYPVRGLDINSSYMIYNTLNEQKKDGVGVLFVGEDLDVMIALCDKIMVLCHGRMMGVVHAHKTTKEELGLMMTGALDLSEKYEDKPAGIAQDTRFGKKRNRRGR